MCTHNGLIDEIPGISIDCFNHQNMSSSIFFLSHCHTDHMNGLGLNTDKIIQKPDVHLYASPQSVAILKNIFPKLEPILFPLDVFRPTIINVPPDPNRFITVQLIPAGHCPGSVMFLFEVENNKNILFTGDFRLNTKELWKFKQFYNISGEIVKIDKMYLDTTFFKENYRYFPPRNDCIEDICKCIKEWITQSKDNNVQIFNPAMIGSEFLYIEIANAIRMPIHVSETKYHEYKCFPEMDGVVTLNKETQIHSSCVKFKTICTTKNVRVIRPTAFIWETKKLQNPEDSEEETSRAENNTFRFCYSSHASYEEIIEFIQFLKPKKITPIVLPSRYKERQDMLDLIEKIIDGYTEKTDDPEELFPLESVMKDDNMSYNGTMESKEIRELLSSPPRCPKRRRSSSNNADTDF